MFGAPVVRYRNLLLNMPVQFQVVVFAFIAAFVLFQLYNVLGKRVGRQPQEDAKIAPPGPAQAETPKVAAIDPATSSNAGRARPAT